MPLLKMHGLKKKQQTNKDFQWDFIRTLVPGFSYHFGLLTASQFWTKFSYKPFNQGVAPRLDIGLSKIWQINVFKFWHLNGDLFGQTV